jgi:hypothetical protein
MRVIPTYTMTSSKRLAQASNGTDASTATQSAVGSVSDLLDVVALLGAALGLQATPGGGYSAAGDGGVFVAAGAPVAAAAGEAAFATLLVRAGPDAAAAASLTTTDGTPGTSARRSLLQGGSSSSSTAPLSAEGYLVLAGAAVSGVAGYTLTLGYVPSADAALASVFDSQLPTTVTLLGGLTSATWGASSASSGPPPTLDGTTSYLLLRIPAPGYDPTRIGTCVLYDTATGTTTGAMPGAQDTAAAASPATFVSYDAASGKVTCRVSQVGAYVLVQGELPFCACCSARTLHDVHLTY